MDNPGVADLASRLSALESECSELRRRTATATGLALASAVICFLLAIEVVRGNFRRSLTVSSLHTSLLKIGKIPGGPALILGTSAAGQPTINFLDAKGTGRLISGLADNGDPYLHLFDGAGIARASFGLLSQRGDVASVLDFRNGRSEARLAIGLAVGDGPRVNLMNSAGEICAGTWVWENGEAQIHLTDSTLGLRRGIRLSAAPGRDPKIEIVKGDGNADGAPLQ
jgi:hypothetical protein